MSSNSRKEFQSPTLRLHGGSIVLLLKRFEQRQFLLHLEFITLLIVWKTVMPHQQTIKLAMCVLYFGEASWSCLLNWMMWCFISEVLIFPTLGGGRNSNSVFLEFQGRWEVLWNHQRWSSEHDPSNWCHWLRFIIFFWKKFGDFFHSSIEHQC